MHPKPDPEPDPDQPEREPEPMRTSSKRFIIFWYLRSRATSVSRVSSNFSCSICFTCEASQWAIVVVAKVTTAASGACFECGGG